MLLVAWLGEMIWPTRDVDLLGFGDLSDSAVAATFSEVVTLDVEPDGVRFDASSIAVAPIRVEDAYGGKRDVAIPETPLALTPAFADVEGKRDQWSGFLRKNGLPPSGFADVVHDVSEFLLPVVKSLSLDHEFEKSWPPRGPGDKRHMQFNAIQALAGWTSAAMVVT